MKLLLSLLSLLIVGSSAQNLYDFQLNDIKTLNYALTLEHLENAYYRDGCNLFTAAQFSTAGFNATVYNYICTLINGHEASHVQALNDTITAAGGVPVRECTYNFTTGYSSVTAFINLAATLENTGVSAYDGAIRTLTNVGYQQVAATIATVEARHAAYLNLLNFVSPFPASFDATLTPAQIVELITVTTGLLVSCSGQPALQLPADAAFAFNNLAINNNTVAANANDIGIINYALTLEFLEYEFYLQAVGNSSVAGLFNEASFTSLGYNASLFSYLGMIRGHEFAHVQTLRTVSSPAITACTYNFTAALANVGAFLTTALELENVGVSAYDGAVNGISNLDYKQLAATIATVEGRHASFLALVNASVPFPFAYEPTLNAAQVIATVIPGLIVNCPFDTNLLTFVAPALFTPASLSTTTAGPTSSSTSGSTSGGSPPASSSTTTGGSTGSASTVSAAFAMIAAILLML